MNFRMKISKLFIAFALLFGMSFGNIVQTDVYAIETRGNESAGGGSSAFISNGSKSYSTTSMRDAYFTVKSQVYQSEKLIISITVTNGRIKETKTGSTLINADGNSNVKETITVGGTERGFKFAPYNNKQASYTIHSVSAQ